MQSLNQSTDPVWPLRRGQTLHRVATQPRWLRVTAGRLWVTRDGRPGELPDDLWLQRGDQLRLARGDGVVLEALEDSAIEWLEPRQETPPC